MKRRWLALGCLAAVSASSACAGSTSGEPQGEPTTQASAGTQAAPGPRQRPRRRAVSRALAATALRAEGCVPPSVTEGVTVTGAFVGTTGELRVTRVESPQPLSQDVRNCIREEFERARVEPFTDPRFEVTHAFGMPAGDAGAPATSVATAPTATGPSEVAAPGVVDAGTPVTPTPAMAASSNTAAGSAMGNAGAPQAAATDTRAASNVAAATTTANTPAPRTIEPTATASAPATPSAATIATANTATAAAPATASPREHGLASPPSRGTPIVQAGPIPAASLIGCYRGAIRTEPILAGRVRLQFTVTNDGVIQNVQVQQLGAIRGRAPVFAQAMRCIEQRVRVQAHNRNNAGYHDLVISLIPRNTGEISIERNNIGLTSSAPGLATSDLRSGTAAPEPTAPAATAVTPDGQLEMSQVANVMRGRVAEIRTCYQTQLSRDPQLALRLRVRFGIEQNGTVPAASSTTVVQAGDGDVASEVARCVEGIVRTTTFPTRTTGGTQEASLPFVFSPGTGTAQATRGAPPAMPTTGRIDPVRVSAVIRNQTPVLRECYTRALAGDPQLAGRVVVRFTVDPYGRLINLTSQAQAQAGDPARLAAVGQCLESVMARMELPPPTGGAAAVALPFDFGPNQ